MQFKQKYGPWSIIAGAAEGMGEAWSIALAKRGMNLIMIDNQEAKMIDLSDRLKKENNIDTLTFTLDLSAKDASDQIMQRMADHECRLLVFNAAYSIIKPFTSLNPVELDGFIDINIYTQLKLVHAFSKYLVEKDNAGGIILMSSLAGLLGMQLVAPYAATKAFTWNLAEALHHELSPHNIDIMACIAGSTATPAYLKTKPKYGKLKPQVMNPYDVADAALEKLGKKTLFIPGFSNRLSYFILTRLMPRKMASRIANNTMKKMYS